MYPYIFMIMLSGCIYFFAEYFTRSFKVLSNLVYILAFVLLSVFSGIRDYSVGTDLYTYGNRIFLDSTVLPYNMVRQNSIRWGDPGYVFLNKVIASFTHNPHVFYGILSFLVLSIFFVAVSSLRKILNVPTAMLLFSFFLWPLDFNILRQGLAISLVVLGFSLLIQKKYIVALGVFICSSLTHNSSIIIVAILIGIFVVFNSDRISHIPGVQLFVIVLIFGFSTVLPLIFSRLPVSILTSLDDRYYYVASSLSLTSFSIGKAGMFSIPLIILLLKPVRSKFVYLQAEARIVYLTVFTLSIINVIFNGFAASNYVLFGRLSYYLYPYLIILLSLTVHMIRRRWAKVAIISLLIIYSIVCFVYLIGVGNYGNLIPFRIDPLLRFF